MKKRDTLLPRATKARGVLYRPAARPAPGYGRFAPPRGLEPFVEHLWTVSWRDLPKAETHETLPHPAVHLTLEPDGAYLFGVPEGRFRRTLEGSGRVLAVKFRPGGFRPFFGQSVADLTGRVIPAREVFGTEIDDLRERTSHETEAEVALAQLAGFLAERRPPRDQRSELASRIVEHASSEPTLTSATELAEAFGLSLRSLQRLFHDAVGVRPKWVLQRFRLHEAAERIEKGRYRSWADLALELGYSDQAHFIRDFQSVVGRPPHDYAHAER